MYQSTLFARPFMNLVNNHSLQSKNLTSAHDTCNVAWTLHELTCTGPLLIGLKSLFELGKPVTQRRIWGSIDQKYDLELMASELVLMPPGQRQVVDFIENVYAPGLLPFMDELVKVGVSEYCKELTLMEDGAPIHTAIASQQWQEENQIHKLVWPAYSPDLNPIENLWFKMKYLLQTSSIPRRWMS
ncbi:hypothetical protein O181_120676 [Austropuccinia psidii MF-1]|uniref:Tc1-like transposase DDE domain-containing protein n=1 Tax=Austropuccinia psidii MF-1 TaxID=1389203 RepID=A0A9Q3KIW2_9BASI|nr:hypothetical protein [Austropuccinia psidii MF-1]